METVKLYNRSFYCCNLYFCFFIISMGKQKQLLLSYNPTLLPSKAHQSFQKNRSKREKSGNKSYNIKSPHQNKKALSQFYYKTNVRHSLSIKNTFYDKMDLRLFYFDEAKCVFVSSPLLFPYKGVGTWACGSACKTLIL